MNHAPDGASHTDATYLANASSVATRYITSTGQIPRKNADVRDGQQADQPACSLACVHCHEATTRENRGYAGLPA